MIFFNVSEKYVIPTVEFVYFVRLLLSLIKQEARYYVLHTPTYQVISMPIDITLRLCGLRIWMDSQKNNIIKHTRSFFAKKHHVYNTFF